MTRVDFVCQRIMLSLLIEQLQRGPRFTRLPPARFYHGHVNEITPDIRVGRRAPRAELGQSRFTVSRRKWMLDPQIDPATAVMPVPLRLPTKAYSYRDFNPLRKQMALRILENMRDTGDVCGINKGDYWHSGEGCPRCCVCTVITTKEFHTHACEHGAWTHN